MIRELPDRAVYPEMKKLSKSNVSYLSPYERSNCPKQPELRRNRSGEGRLRSRSQFSRVFGEMWMRKKVRRTSRGVSSNRGSRSHELPMVGWMGKSRLPTNYRVHWRSRRISRKRISELFAWSAVTNGAAFFSPQPGQSVTDAIHDGWRCVATL